MTTLEIILLILGAVIFIGSFIVPESKSEMEEVDKQLTQEQIQEMLKAELKSVRSQVEDTVEETVSYSMERTERALERISNEKLTAISEYTETVLTDIHKSHEEVLFLYDMLNDKHQNIKETASEVTKAVKEVNEVVQEADIVKKEVSEATQALDEAFKPMDISGLEKLKQQSVEIVSEAEADVELTKPAKKKATRQQSKALSQKTEKTETGNISLQFDSAQGAADNNNERILELHKKGKSNVAIAKELGLGVGEVKLVIDLFKGI
ncbi:MAG: hypothetical protein E7289_08120 [Lachnospiraceae bacterium]|nr:hypothetical protein [Lachnospiraceae bacterium]